MTPCMTLDLAITAEVIATSAIKATVSFTRPWPSVLMVAAYGAAFYFFIGGCQRPTPQSAHRAHAPMAKSSNSLANANEVDAPVPPVTTPRATPALGCALNTTSWAEA